MNTIELRFRAVAGVNLEKAWKSSGLSQEKFAESIGESRTTVSHVINAVKPSTPNPEHRSLKVIIRINRKLKNMAPLHEDSITALKELVHRMHSAYIDALGRYTTALAVGRQARKPVPETVRRGATKPKPVKQMMLPGHTPKTKKSMRLRKPAVGQGWIGCDPRRVQIVRITAVHASHISYVNVRTGRTGRSAATTFVKRFKPWSKPLPPRKTVR